jgi:hypothetical protein
MRRRFYRVLRGEREALAWSSPNNAMMHIAIQEACNGKVVDWMEKVTDEQYQSGVRTEVE